MKEFEPKLKKNVFTKEFFSKYIYIFVIGLCLLFGVSYSLTFFVQNENITTGSITTGNLTVTFTDQNINVEGMLPPTTDQEGLLLYAKQVTINNTTNIDGKVKLFLTRTSGLNLTDLKYAIFVNGAIQMIDDVPANGQILSSAIMGNETLDVEVRIWPKTTYTGGVTTFVGELTPEITYFGSKASNISSPAGKYVKFNCNGNNCEVWQIVKVEDARLVLTRQADYTGATERTYTGKYYSGLTFNDDSLIFAVSDDNEHKNVYLLRTVKIADGSGTQADPYVLTNDILSEPDKKVIATITYQEASIPQVNANDVTAVGTQKLYYNQTNYISQILVRPFTVRWTDGNVIYEIGDTVNFVTNTSLVAEREASAIDIGYDNTITNFNCDNVQCALVALYNYRH